MLKRLRLANRKDVQKASRHSATVGLQWKALGDAKRPAYYLAIPPTMFGVVVEQLGRSGCAKGARVIIEKPFGRDRTSARALDADLHRFLAEEQRFFQTGFAKQLARINVQLHDGWK